MMMTMVMTMVKTILMKMKVKPPAPQGLLVQCMP